VCRFLLMKAKWKIDAGPILKGFAGMARMSRSPDGDRQGDGWGMSRLSDAGDWSHHKSLKPVWEDPAAAARIPRTRALVLHARSSSFVRDKGTIGFNQPYGEDGFVFVFNGLLEGVRLPRRTEGKIGAQKIWSLLKIFLRGSPPDEAMVRLTACLYRNARRVSALNLGICDGRRIYFYTSYDNAPEYYQLYYAVSGRLSIVSSEPILGYAFRPVSPGTVQIL